jgi:hypothetical protein
MTESNIYKEFEGTLAIPKEDGSGEVFVRVPHFKDGKTPPGLAEAIKFAREHPETKLFVWTGEELRQL